MSGKQNKNIPQHHEPVSPAAHTRIAFNVPKWAPIAIIVFTALLYSKALYNGITSVDDDFYITKNPFLRDFSWHGVWAIFTSFYATNYHPLTTLTYLFEFQGFGMNPLPYHLLNVLLHLLNIWLVYKLVQRLSSKDITALVVCILFAVHPMHVESVAWISERKDVLYSAFYLSALLYYLRYLQSGYKAKYYIIMLLLFVASLLSKSAAVTLPVLLIIIDVYKGRKINTRSLLEKAPLLLLSVLFGIMAILSQRAGGAINDFAASYSTVSRLFIFTSGLAFYFLKLVAPFGLSVLHYSPYVLGENFQWQYYASLPFLLLIGWLVVRASSLRREIIFGMFFFLAAISVMLQILPVGSAFTAERYTYIPYIGLFYIVGQWIADTGIRKWRTVVMVVFSLIVALFSILTWNRISVWKDDNSLFNDLVDTNPEIYYSYYLRANMKKAQGDIRGALDDYNKAIQLNPGYADSYYKRSLMYDALGDPRAAIIDYSTVIHATPDFAPAYNNRGWDYYQTGDRSSAMLDYNKAISLDSSNPQAYNNRGWAYYQAGDLRAALPDFDRAILLDPRFDKPHYNRADIRESTGDMKGAIEDFDFLIKLHNDDHVSYYRRGMARLKLSDTTGACTDWQRAIELGDEKASEAAHQYCH